MQHARTKEADEEEEGEQIEMDEEGTGTHAVFESQSQKESELEIEIKKQDDVVNNDEQLSIIQQWSPAAQRIFWISVLSVLGVILSSLSIIVIVFMPATYL